jgi:linoleoyl-CoA desaturase
VLTTQTADERPPASQTPFGVDLTARIESLATPDVLREARRRLHTKAVIIGFWYFAAFAATVVAPNPAIGFLACVSLGFAIAAVGFNIQHDANHNAFVCPRASRRLTLKNRAAGLSLNLIGGSQARWIDGHVQQHHSSPNVVGKDFDIELAPFVRMAPQQPHRPWHRHQHRYVWFIYSFASVAIFVSDVANTVLESFKDDRHGRRSSWRDYTAMFGTKVVFLAVMIGIPLTQHSAGAVAAGAVVVAGVSGLILGVVFQLAHVVEATDFRDLTTPVPCRWHEWQVRSTADFSQGPGPVSAAVTWYAGGLNYQIEHHLFPQLPHTIYPLIAPVVAQTCVDHGIAYNSTPTLRAAINGHYRHLRELGAIGSEGSGTGPAVVTPTAAAKVA